MTHDPLCPYVPPRIVHSGNVLTPPREGVPCQCDLIAKVRSDQDRKHWDKTKHLRDRIERLVTKANRWRDENADLRKQLKAMTP